VAASLSTHVLDTGQGKPAGGVTVELFRESELVAEGTTDGDGRISALAEALEPGRYRLVFHPPSPYFRRVELDEQDKIEALAAHPAIGATHLSERSAAEQGTQADPVVMTELSYLNQVYEEKFGFRFVVFVNSRPKSEILEVLRQRLERTRDEELQAGLEELVAIARDRYQRG
jgi:hypothetical protein